MTRHRRNRPGSRILAAVLLLAAASVALTPASRAQPAESSWPQYQYDARHTGRSGLVGPTWPTDARRRCRVELTGTRAGLPVTGADGTIYVASGGNDDDPSTWGLAAIDPNDCSEKWTVALPGAPEVAAPAVSRTGTVYLYTDADGGNIFGGTALNIVSPTGTLTESIELGSAFSATAISSPVIAADGSLWVASTDTLVRHFEEDGDLICSAQSPTVSSYHASPAVAADGTTYVLDAVNELTALDPACQQDWTLSLQDHSGGGSAPVVGDDGTIYVGAAHDLVAVGPDGVEDWRYDLGTTIETTPALGDDGTIYVGADGLYALDPADHDQRWHTACDPYGTDLFSYSSPVVDGAGTVYFGAGFDLCAFRPTGQRQWNRSIDPGHGPNLAISADGALLATGGGDLGTATFLEVLEPAPRPDGLIKKAGGTLKGGDVYNTTGVGQTVGATVPRGTTAVYVVSVQNDGRYFESFLLQGSPSPNPTRFRVKYLEPDGDPVSNAVTAGTYTTPSIAPGGSFKVRVQVTVLAAAPAGAVFSGQVTVRSSLEPTIRDVVKFTTRRA